MPIKKKKKFFKKEMIPEAAEADSKRTMEKLIFALCKGAPVG